jgi:hypothetical protein
MRQLAFASADRPKRISNHQHFQGTPKMQAISRILLKVARHLSRSQDSTADRQQGGNSKDYTCTNPPPLPTQLLLTSGA